MNNVKLKIYISNFVLYPVLSLFVNSTYHPNPFQNTQKWAKYHYKNPTATSSSSSFSHPIIILS